VSVKYVGRFLNGMEFDSNIGSEPFKFVLGEGNISHYLYGLFTKNLPRLFLTFPASRAEALSFVILHTIEPLLARHSWLGIVF